MTVPDTKDFVAAVRKAAEEQLANMDSIRGKVSKAILEDCKSEG